MHDKMSGFTLVHVGDRLTLQRPDDVKFTPFYIDFLAGKLRYRAEQAGLKREMLARALGKKPKEEPRIVDATAGLGRDSFILACLGFNVILLERSAILHALLQDAMHHAKVDPEMAPVIARMQLIHADATSWLAQLPEADRPDIIYLDPMFPERQKSASVKKEMVILQQLLGAETDSEALLNMALACSKHRVVVKRPRLAPALTNQPRAFSLTGKSSRFDIYLV